MKAAQPCLSDLGIINVLGCGKADVAEALFTGTVRQDRLIFNNENRFPFYALGNERYPEGPSLDHQRTFSLASECLNQISSTVEKAVESYGLNRIGAVIGSTDNGSEQALAALQERHRTGSFPSSYTIANQAADSTAGFLKLLGGFAGPVFTISTACSSSAVALASARELIQSDICDVVIAGGVDIVSEAVYKGFLSLEAMSPELCNPFSRNRRGITLGEAAALFVVRP